MLIEEKHDVACYARRTEKLTLGEATLLRVTYCFFQGRFYTASLDFEGSSNIAPFWKPSPKPLAQAYSRIGFSTATSGG